MDEALVKIQGEIFTWVYIGCIGILALIEIAAPRRSLTRSLRLRWTNNALLFVISLSFTRLVLPLSCIAAALIASQKNWGILSSEAIPIWVHVSIAVLVLDVTRYATHYLLHHSPILWRLHRVHHTDQDFDISTALRFHPVEMLFQAAINVLVVISIGMEPIAVFVFECWAIGANFFTHGNIRISDQMDKWLRVFIVTPDMHRVHHSVLREEYDSNYGLLFSWWDRLFGTYVHIPRAGHQGMTLGLRGFEAQDQSRIDRMLLNPFLGVQAPPRREAT